MAHVIFSLAAARAAPAARQPSATGPGRRATGRRVGGPVRRSGDCGPLPGVDGPARGGSQEHLTAVSRVRLTGDQPISLKRAYQPGHGGRADLFSGGQRSKCERPAKHDHRERGESRGGQAAGGVHGSQAAQQMDGGRVQLIGERVERRLNRLTGRPGVRELDRRSRSAAHLVLWRALGSGRRRRARES